MEPVHFIKISFDVIILMITLVAWALVHFVLPIRKSGFNCDDYSISLPYKDSTVTNSVLIVICTAVPIVVICGTELARNFYPSLRQRTNKYVYKVKMLKNSSLNVPEVVGNIYINLGSYFFGLLVVQFLTNLAKYTIGRPRPHYIDICKPVFTVANLTRVDCRVKEYFAYGVDYTCSTLNKPRMDEANLSFPSGHASTSFYTMIFLILYVKYTWNCRRIGLIAPFTQIVLFSVAFFTGLTRVVDHKHHFTDVLAGSFLGTVFAVLAFVFLTDLVNKKRHGSSVTSLPSLNNHTMATHGRSNSRGFSTSNNGMTTVFIENT